jgi:hypothetical protein
MRRTAKTYRHCTHATFNKTETTTPIGILQESGHPEPWYIAMDAEPTRETVLDYGKR